MRRDFLEILEEKELDLLDFLLILEEEFFINLNAEKLDWILKFLLSRGARKKVEAIQKKIELHKKVDKEIKERAQLKP